MGRYTTIPQDTFNALQLDAGVLLKNFDIEAAASDDDATGFTDADIICATTGGVNPSCVPTFSDLGEDIDNVPSRMKELQHLDSFDCKLATTSLGTSASLIKMSLGCADTSEDGKSIIPRADLKQSDFSDIWWVGDKANGGLVAVRLMNALSTGGFSLQTSKNGKGQTALELTGHVSINAQKVVPMVFYSIDPVTVPTYTVTFNVDGGSTVEPQEIQSGGLVVEPETPTKEGFEFAGWYADSGKTATWDFASNIVIADTVIYAKWTATMSLGISRNQNLFDVYINDESVEWAGGGAYGTNAEVAVKAGDTIRIFADCTVTEEQGTEINLWKNTEGAPSTPATNLGNGNTATYTIKATDLGEDGAISIGFNGSSATKGGTGDGYYYLNATGGADSFEFAFTTAN